MTISVAQAVAKNTLSSTITATGGTGDRALIVCIDSYNATAAGSISSVKLGTSNLVQAVAATDTADGFESSWIYYLLGIPSGQTSVVVAGSNLSVASADGGVYIAEVAGLALSGALDKSVPASNTNTTYSVSSGALSQADEFVIATADGINLGNASGWTMIGSSGGGGIAGYKIVSATTAQTFSGAATSGGWCAALASFKMASLLKPGAAAAVASML
jgi:hypothetical protein